LKNLKFKNVFVDINEQKEMFWRKVESLTKSMTKQELLLIFDKVETMHIINETMDISEKRFLSYVEEILKKISPDPSADEIKNWGIQLRIRLLDEHGIPYLKIQKYATDSKKNISVRYTHISAVLDYVVDTSA
jgi:hypothetical protein